MRWRQAVPHDDRPTCERCGQGKLGLIDERPDPIFGVLGMPASVASSQLSEPAGD